MNNYDADEKLTIDEKSILNLIDLYQNFHIEDESFPTIDR